MISRTWSLATGPAVIFAGIVSTVTVATLIFSDNSPLKSKDLKKEDKSK